MAEFNCINCKYGMTTDDYEHCGNCDKGSNFVKMTNAEKIRAMSDEELSEFLGEFATRTCHYCLECGISCKDERLKWLKAEAEGE